MPTARPQKKTAATKSSRAVKTSAKATAVPAAKKTAKKKSAVDPTNPQRVETILHRLAEHYPHAVCALHHRNAWELMVATILSAQCTDVRVNMVTPALFQRFPTPQAMAKASQAEVEEIFAPRDSSGIRRRTLSARQKLLLQNSAAKFLRRWKNC